MNTFEINKHTNTKRECPQCHILYFVQGGGQKSGSSPAVHIDHGVQGRVVGFCSSRCLSESQGVRIEDTLAYKQFASWDLSYDEIFPVGYLAPARILDRDTDSADAMSVVNICWQTVEY